MGKIYFYSQRITSRIQIVLVCSNPTPDGVTLLDGIPKFLPYDAVEQSYMKIHENWEVKSDYTLTYTITVDELNPTANFRPNSKKVPVAPLPNMINYFGN